MATYAEINTDNVVVNTIVADAEYIAAQTDKNYVESTDENRASVGDTYNAVANVFIEPQPFPSWILDSNYAWQPPTPRPSTGGPYLWNEANQQWDELIAPIGGP